MVRVLQWCFQDAQGDTGRVLFCFFLIKSFEEKLGVSTLNDLTSSAGSLNLVSLKDIYETVRYVPGSHIVRVTDSQKRFLSKIKLINLKIALSGMNRYMPLHP